MIPTLRARDRAGGPHSVLAELDTLRALAIALVVATHAEGLVGGGRPAGEPLYFGRALLCIGHTGVSLFFVLSAFLISRPFWAEVLGGPRVDLLEFLRRRCWRILPVYVVAVLGTAALLSATPGDVWRALPYLAFVPNAFIAAEQRIPPHFSGVWWSLSTEVQFYLFLPLLALVCRSRAGWRGGALLCALVGVGYALVVANAFPGATTVHIRFTLLHMFIGRAPLFACGAVAALLFVRFGASWGVLLARSRYVAAGGLDMLLGGVVLAFLLSLGWAERTIAYTALEVAYPLWHVPEGILWAAVVLGVSVAPLRWRHLIAMRPLVWVGCISYSVYLLHMPVLWFGLRAARGVVPWRVGWDVWSVPVVLTLAAVTVGIAALTFRAIEAPLMRRRPRTVPGPVRDLAEARAVAIRSAA
jgi:peptidoglycan/LPS O-acetylase OafA/YrhL